MTTFPHIPIRMRLAKRGRILSGGQARRANCGVEAEMDKLCVKVLKRETVDGTCRRTTLNPWKWNQSASPTA